MLSRRLPTTLVERFAFIIADLQAVVAAEGHSQKIGGPFTSLIWRRLGRLAQCVANLLVTKPRKPREPCAAPEPAAKPASPPVPPPPPTPATTPIAASATTPSKPTLPRHFGWLSRLLGYRIRGHAGQLAHLLLTDPEMTALLAADPRLGRVLRPLCHLLGIQPPETIRLPPRPRRAKPKPPKAAHPKRQPKPPAHPLILPPVPWLSDRPIPDRFIPRAIKKPT
ncbi:MAG: hypothetical protein ACYCZB_16945 [Acidiphilium sp.]